MNIGILTFAGTSNFGASLQAYALQQVILGKGHTCEIIRYECPSIKAVHDPKRAFRSRGILLFIAPIRFLSYKKRMDKFVKFDKEFCVLSEKCDSSSIKKITEKYDKIIVGSDQVWNPEITGNDLSFFLDFIDDSNKKCSYAASIGKEYYSSNCEIYESLINKFSIISVREQNTANILQQRINRKDITCDVDPTILLREEWTKFVKSSYEKNDYILLYLTPTDNEFIKTIKQFAETNNCRIIHLSRSMRQKHSGIKRISNVSPADFINYIAHAKYVITGSFHALCFSIMLRKDFYVTSSPVKERSGRLMQFLSCLGLEDRIISSDKYNIQKIQNDYDLVDKELDKLRDKSFCTIDKILNE